MVNLNFKAPDCLKLKLFSKIFEVDIQRNMAFLLGEDWRTGQDRMDGLDQRKSCRIFPRSSCTKMCRKCRIICQRAFAFSHGGIDFDPLPTEKDENRICINQKYHLPTVSLAHWGRILFVVTLFHYILDLRKKNLSNFQKPTFFCFRNELNQES